MLLKIINGKNIQPLQIYTAIWLMYSCAVYLQVIRQIYYYTFSIPPRDVTSTKRRCKSKAVPPMVGILQSKQKVELHFRIIFTPSIFSPFLKQQNILYPRQVQSRQPMTHPHSTHKKVFKTEDMAWLNLFLHLTHLLQRKFLIILTIV